MGTSGTCAVGVCTIGDGCGGGAIVACGVGEMHEGMLWVQLVCVQ